MTQVFKIIIAAVISFVVYRIITSIGEIGNLDTTGKAPAWLTVVAIIVSLILFIWCVSKINKSN